MDNLIYRLLMAGITRVTTISWCARLLNWEWCFLPLPCKRCRTHPSKPLLVWLSSILIFLGPFSVGMLTPFFMAGSSGAFYSARSFVPLNGEKTLWLLRLWWYSESGRAIIILQAADRDCWGDDLPSPLSFHSTGDAGQVVAGRL